MREFDLHGMHLPEAEALFHKLLNEIRLAGKAEEILFITGIGVLQDRLKELSKEQGLYHYVQMGNRGCLVVEFE